MDDVRIWTRTAGQTEGQGTFPQLPWHVVIVTHNRERDLVERWELKVKLDCPSVFDRHREVEVTSVNWEDEVAAAHISRVLVSYRWHGIVYALKFSPNAILHTSYLISCWDITKMSVLWHIPIDEW
jgi:hypothetical protein